MKMPVPLLAECIHAAATSVCDVKSDIKPLAISFSKRDHKPGQLRNSSSRAFGCHSQEDQSNVQKLGKYLKLSAEDHAFSTAKTAIRATQPHIEYCQSHPSVLPRRCFFPPTSSDAVPAPAPSGR